MTVGNDEAIRQRAYHIWLEQGQPDGQSLEHWLQAEAELAALAVATAILMEDISIVQEEPVAAEVTAAAAPVVEAPPPAKKPAVRKKPAATPPAAKPAATKPAAPKAKSPAKGKTSAKV